MTNCLLIDVLASAEVTVPWCSTSWRDTTEIGTSPMQVHEQACREKPLYLFFKLLNHRTMKFLDTIGIKSSVHLKQQFQNLVLYETVIIFSANDIASRRLRPRTSFRSFFDKNQMTFLVNRVYSRYSKNTYVS